MLPEIHQPPQNELARLESYVSSVPSNIANRISVLCAEAAAISVSGPENLAQAKETLAQLRKAKKSLEAWFAPAKDALNRIRSTMQATIKYYTDQIDAHDKRLAAEILATEKAIREANRQQAQAASAAPWETESASTVPMIAVPDGPARVAKLPPVAEVYDKRAFLEAALRPGNEAMLDFITFDSSALNAEAKRLGRAIEEVYPGVRYVERETVRVR